MPTQSTPLDVIASSETSEAALAADLETAVAFVPFLEAELGLEVDHTDEAHPKLENPFEEQTADSPFPPDDRSDPASVPSGISVPEPVPSISDAHSALNPQDPAVAVVSADPAGSFIPDHAANESSRGAGLGHGPGFGPPPAVSPLSGASAFVALPVPDPAASIGPASEASDASVTADLNPASSEATASGGHDGASGAADALGSPANDAVELGPISEDPVQNGALVPDPNAPESTTTASDERSLAEVATADAPGRPASTGDPEPRSPMIEGSGPEPGEAEPGPDAEGRAEVGSNDEGSDEATGEAGESESGTFPRADPRSRAGAAPAATPETPDSPESQAQLRVEEPRAENRQRPGSPPAGQPADSVTEIAANVPTSGSGAGSGSGVPFQEFDLDPADAQPSTVAEPEGSPDPLSAMDSAEPAAETLRVSSGELKHLGIGDEVRIRLSSEQLGRVELHALSRESGAIEATLGADRPEVQQLLRRELPSLESALEDRDLPVEMLSVSDGLDERSSNDSGGSRAPLAEEPVSRPASEAASTEADSNSDAGDETRLAPQHGRIDLHV